MVAPILPGLGGGGWTAESSFVQLSHSSTSSLPCILVTSHHPQEILTLKAFLYIECNSLLSKFCFAKDQCILHIASKFLRTSVQGLDQVLKRREKRSSVVCIGQRLGCPPGRQ